MAIPGINGVNSLVTSPMKFDRIQGEDDNSVSFSEFLNNALNKTNDLLVQADNMNEDFAAGKIDNIHDVMIASEKADIALQFTMQIRNKIMDAYSEIMRMQI